MTFKFHPEALAEYEDAMHCHRKPDYWLRRIEEGEQGADRKPPEATQPPH